MFRHSYRSSPAAAAVTNSCGRCAQLLLAPSAHPPLAPSAYPRLAPSGQPPLVPSGQLPQACSTSGGCLLDRVPSAQQQPQQQAPAAGVGAAAYRRSSSSASGSASSRTMEVAVRSVTGQTFHLDNVPPSASVADLKLQLEQHAGVPPNFQRLIFNGRELRDEDSLEHVNVRNGAVLHIAIRQQASASASAPSSDTSAAAPPSNAVVNQEIVIPVGSVFASQRAGMNPAEYGAELDDPAAAFRRHKLRILSISVQVAAFVNLLLSLVVATRAPIGIVFGVACACAIRGARCYRPSWMYVYAVFVALFVGGLLADMFLHAISWVLVLMAVSQMVFLVRVCQFIKECKQASPSDLDMLRLMQHFNVFRANARR